MSMPVLRDQISIYNYPEHLNPFYCDDQHRRLRFWKIKKDKVDPTSLSNKKSSTNLRRSGSTFSLGSIKDWLPLKAFSLRKKSSSLGISKTSESPPSLHRDMTAGRVMIEDPSKYTTYNPHFRRSTGANGSNNYRSSLQNMNPSSQYNNFLQPRNSRWRQTIQNGAITPSMLGRYRSENNMQAGISMSSINTNPFDDDYDEESILSTSTTHLSSLAKRKKKRRAPLPPTQTIASSLSSSSERVNKSEINGCESIQAEGISRLTEDFQKFVMATGTSEGLKVEPNDEKELTKLRIDEDLSTMETHKRIELREATPDSIPLPVREHFEVLRIVEDCKQDVEEPTIVKSDEPVVEDTQNSLNNCQNHQISSNELNENETKIYNFNQEIIIREEEDENGNDVNRMIESVESINATAKPDQSAFNELETFPNNHQPELSLATSTSSSTSANDLDSQVVYRNVQLRTVDNSEGIVSNTERVKVSSFIVETPRCAYQDRATFIESFMSSSSYRRERDVTPIPRPRTERDSSPPEPPARRRSVKDIIESINRNQQLLKTTTPPEDPRTKFMKSERSSSFSIHDQRRFEEISSNEKKVELLLDDLRNSTRKCSK